MAALPQNNTDRMFVEYTSIGMAHRMDVRLKEGAGVDGAQTLYALIAAALAPMMSVQDTFTGARFHSAGTQNSFPLPVQSVQGTNNGGYDLANRPNFASITGASTDGRAVKLTFFSVYFEEDANYRELPAEQPTMQELLTIVATPANNVCTISGESAIWNQYVNIGVSAYYQRKLRRG